ncbi:hypothetical protein K435DRAFT_848404 [Dendrothele bispora CBS 962.96]|uniref:Uncharacterized protein n=1 Tax=Dendrothele bispora (strain CBS 962.96) TaxID=1314807 RepID=A0A4S8MVF6_DENBC|nr:hypothetical protein K435DRAFT_848404 [Dendrothele bispora CBS 962.96]
MSSEMQPALLPQLPIDPYYQLLQPDIVWRPLPPPFELKGLTPLFRNSMEAFLSSLNPESLGTIWSPEEESDQRPIDNSVFFRDDDNDKHVYLVVHLDEQVKEPSHRHWGIRWVVDSCWRKTPEAARCLEVITDLRGQRLVNWGPLTQVHRYHAMKSDKDTAVFSLGVFSRQQRDQLEAIAWHIPVLMPLDGEWNCQNWVASLLGVAVARGLISLDVVKDVMEKASEKEIPIETTRLKLDN